MDCDPVSTFVHIALTAQLFGKETIALHLDPDYEADRYQFHVEVFGLCDRSRREHLEVADIEALLDKLIVDSSGSSLTKDERRLRRKLKAGLSRRQRN